MNKEIEVFDGEVLPAIVSDGRPYPLEVLDPDADDGTIVENVEELERKIVGSKIVRCDKVTRTVVKYGTYTQTEQVFVITLENNIEVQLIDTDDCCATTFLESFLLNPQLVDHIITGVGTTDGYCTWHIYCDLGDILKLDVGWSCGNPFYYGYGFDIKVILNAGIEDQELESKSTREIGQ